LAIFVKDPAPVVLGLQRKDPVRADDDVVDVVGPAGKLQIVDEIVIITEEGQNLDSALLTPQSGTEGVAETLLPAMPPFIAGQNTCRQEG
jgi:hypothetical protein